MFLRINDVDIGKACKSPKMQLLSKLLVTLQPQWALFVENMQSTQLKVEKITFFCFGSSGARVGAPQEQTRSSGAGSVLLRSTPGSELLRSQGRRSSGAGARGGLSHERPSPTTPSPSTSQARTQAQPNSRKPSVHSPGAEAPLAMQGTRPNEIPSPGVRLHPKACAA